MKPSFTRLVLLLKPIALYFIRNSHTYVTLPCMLWMAVRDAFVPILTLILGLELDKSSSPLTPISLEWNYMAPPLCIVLTFLSSRTKGSNSFGVCGYVIVCLVCIDGGLSTIQSKPYTSMILRSGRPAHSKCRSSQNKFSQTE